MSKVNTIYTAVIIIFTALAFLIFPKSINAEEMSLDIQDDESLITLSEESKANEEILLEKYINENNGEYTCEKTIDGGIVITTHHYSESAIKEPGCVEPGYERYVCDICHKEVVEEFPLKDHVIVDGVCINCGKSDVSVEAETKQEAYVEDAFDLESAYTNYLRMPNETMRTAYLDSLTDENRLMLESYIKEQITQVDKEEETKQEAIEETENEQM